MALNVKYSPQGVRAALRSANQDTLIDDLKDALVSVAWSASAWSDGGNQRGWILTSPATGQGLALGLKLWRDSTQADRAFIRAESEDHLTAGLTVRLAAAVGWQHIAHCFSYGVFIYLPGSTAVYTSFAAFTVWVPDFMAPSITRAILYCGDCNPNNPADNQTALRKQNNPRGNMAGAMINANAYSGYDTWCVSPGGLVYNPADSGNTFIPARWVNGHYMSVEPWIAAPAAMAGGERFFIGQMYDALLANTVLPGDTETAFDGKNFLNYTYSDTKLALLIRKP